MPDPPLIAVDWGSTNFRAALVVEGEVVDRIESSKGIKNVGEYQGLANGSDFEYLLEGLCHEWIDRPQDPQIILSGMIGSREGWIEIPYADTPLRKSDLADRLTKMETSFSDSVEIVPGVRHQNEDGTFDVMRGEETQAFGLLKTLETENAVICAPGTHSKWIVCRNGRIEKFRTWATGETFQLLSQHSLLTGHEAANAIHADSDAFRRGLQRSGRTGGLLHHLFLGRTDMLMKLVAPEDLPSLLSGLLLGHEIREAKTMVNNETVNLIASDTVAPVYEAAFKALGLSYFRCQEDVHTAGIAAIRAACAG